MKTLEWVKENLNNMETSLDSRLGRRLCEFIPKEEMEKLGYVFEENETYPETIKSWTEENVLAQLREDLEFGIEKATHHRGISASLMWEVCMAWCMILENGLDEAYEDEYGWYGDKLFSAIDQKYHFGLIDADTFDEEFYERW